MEIRRYQDTVIEPEALSDDMIFLDTLLVEDVRHLCGITALTGFFTEEEVLIVEELAWSAITEGEESDYSFLLALPGNGDRKNPIGFACFGKVPCTQGSWDLYWIVVDGQLQGHGYGRSILREVEKRIHAQDGRKIFLETSSREQYLSTRGFYESNGYLMESTLRDYYNRGEDCLIYSKELR